MHIYIKLYNFCCFNFRDISESIFNALIFIICECFETLSEQKNNNNVQNNNNNNALLSIGTKNNYNKIF